MTDDSIELTRRKILGSVGAVGLAGAGAGMGTSALFTDEEEFENNTLTAGTLDLKIDWQQRYWGPQGTGAPYGEAGRPWVNAHPDHDGDGIQSLDSDQYGSVPDDGVVTYQDAGANIQRYLICETLSQEYDFGDQEALVELADVKPGDHGEITFSYHICDNAGYVWLCGDLVDASENGVTEPEGRSESEEDDVVELLDAVNVQVWYDVDCDNEFEESGEELLAGSPTTLRSFLDAFEETSDGCLMLNAGRYPGIRSTYGCLELDTIEFSETGLSVDGAGEVVRVDEGDPNDDTDNLEVWVLLEDPDNGAFDGAVVLFDDMYTEFGTRPNTVDELGGIVQFDWTLVDQVQGDDGETYESDDYGMCELVLTDDTGSTTADLIGSACSTGENDVVVPNGGEVVRGVDFSYCAPGEGDPVCFPSGRTFCVGFEWWVPDHVGNEIQSDTVAFDLGFYTEQCRNNDDPGQSL